jgi:hypothetical protein
MSSNSVNYDTGKQGENSSWEVMAAKGFYRPTKDERKTIAAAFAAQGKTIAPKGFDLVELHWRPPLKSGMTIAADKMVLYELKTAGAKRKTSLKSNFNGLGFTLTANEEHNHSVLGDSQYKFILLDLKTHDCLLCTKDDFYSRARIYPTKSIFITEGIPNGSRL